MIKYFIMELEDGRQVKVSGEVLKNKFPTPLAEELVTSIKNETFQDLLIRMADEITILEKGITNRKDVIEATENNEAEI
jgi:hypothetical protein